VLDSVLDPADRTAQLARQPAHQHLLGIRLELGAESAADVWQDHADALGVQPERRAENGLDPVRHLGRGPHGEALGDGVPFGHHAASLHWAARLAANGESLAHLIGRLGESSLDVSARCLENLVHVAVLVDRDAAVLGRLVGVADDIERRVLDVHQRGQVLGGVAIGRDNDRHRFAEVTHAVARQDRLRGGQLGPRPERSIAGQEGELLAEVGGAQDGDRARVGPGRGQVDRPDHRVCQRAAHHRGVEKAVTPDVRDVAPIAA